MKLDIVILNAEALANSAVNLILCASKSASLKPLAARALDALVLPNTPGPCKATKIAAAAAALANPIPTGPTNNGAIRFAPPVPPPRGTFAAGGTPCAGITIAPMPCCAIPTANPAKSPIWPPKLFAGAMPGMSGASSASA